MGDQIRRWLLLWIALIAAPADAGERWAWVGRAGDRRPVVIDLVRADVVVEHAPIATGIAIGSSGGAARIEVVDQSDGVRVGDQYPARPAVAAMADCLPPADERGDYWTYPARFSVRVRLRPGQSLRIRLKQGNIRLPADLGGIDAATADGLTKCALTCTADVLRELLDGSGASLLTLD